MLTPENKLFLDCGAHDGCSVVKWKILFPHYDIISFEGNPELWKYFERLPTRLERKLVTDFDGEVEFFLDPIDADGSSIIRSKRLDAHGIVNNEDCPSRTVECVDISKVIQENSAIYSEIILKLDVEGAEYAILEKLLKDGTIKLIKKLYAEFHWDKIGLSKESHNSTLRDVSRHVDVQFWGAEEYQVHRKGPAALQARDAFVKTFFQE